jgi:phage gp29-like protein
MPQTTILGPDGRPLRLPGATELQEPQTAKLTHLQQEFARHPARGLTPRRLASILDQAEQGDLVSQFELFEDMEEKDGHIASEMGKRRRALLVDWDVVPPDSASAGEKKAAEQLAELLGEIPDFEDVLFDLTDAIGKGFANLELGWRREQRFWLPLTITHRPQAWFQTWRGERQQIRLRSNSMGEDGAPGEALRPLGWITHVHKAKSGYIERTSLFRQLTWTYLFKNYAVGDLAEFLEIYGIPIRLGKYPSSATEPEKASLLRALAGIGHKASGIVPESMLIEFQKATEGDPKAFDLMISWCERNQSKVILGGTLTSGADGAASTNALGNVHNEVRKDLRAADVRQVNSTITRDLVYAIAVLNGLAPDGMRRCPRFKLKVDEPEDLKTYADALPKLVGIGVKPTVQWAHERLGIPLPEAGDDVLRAPKAPEPAPQPPARAEPVEAPPQPEEVDQAAAAALIGALRGRGNLASLAAALARAAAEPVAQPVMPMAPRLAQRVAPAVDGWIDQVRVLVNRAQSLEEIRDGLEQLLPGMTLQQYADAMAQALAAAALAGRYEILQEAAAGAGGNG